MVVKFLLVVQICCGSKKIRRFKFVEVNIFGGQHLFEGKQFLVLKFFWRKFFWGINIFGGQTFWDSKMLRGKKL